MGEPTDIQRMMRAELESGKIIDLVRDCECITHDGPHWLHMDQLSKQRNYKNHQWALESEPPKTNQRLYALQNAIRSYALHESIRLGELRREMERHKICRIISES